VIAARRVKLLAASAKPMGTAPPPRCELGSSAVTTVVILSETHDPLQHTSAPGDERSAAAVVRAPVGLVRWVGGWVGG
jgi:hypothetical protein